MNHYTGNFKRCPMCNKVKMHYSNDLNTWLCYNIVCHYSCDDPVSRLAQFKHSARLRCIEKNKQPKHVRKFGSIQLKSVQGKWNYDD